MRGLLGDRFLRRFAGDLKHRRKLPASTSEGRNPEGGVDATLESEAVRSDHHVSEEDREEAVADAAVADAAVADANDVHTRTEPNKKNETGPKGENPNTLFHVT